MRLAEILSQRRLDALIVSGPPNIRYLCGFTGSNGLLLVEASGAAVLFTDPRYDIQARRQTDCPVNVAKQPLTKALLAVARRRGLGRLGFEAARLSFAEHAILSEGLWQGARLEPQKDLVECLRMVKSAAEIQAIRQSMLTVTKALPRALRSLRAGTLETELAAEIDYQMRRLGAEKAAFDTIVLYGERTAQPHACPGPNPLQPNQLVLIDVGAFREGYASDMTRVVVKGSAPQRLRRIHRAVLEAQAAALEAVRPGVTAGAVDAAARRVLKRHGLEKAFTHSTGHGVGLEVHEAPRLGKQDATPLEAGMVITVEPGAYIEGVGGVRIEDTVVVTSNGCENLTPAPKELLSL